ncbi:uncharacterized protein LOC135224573 isoform X2 [Macrobrachium nipponense]|uniref:uncharacterized protein LOC135224573 isoform X2 n=1 Tax=Macrobrachium nipponense TaxID=159736 RepID=UPI0030C7C0B7
MLAQTASAALYLQTTNSRELRITRLNNNNSHEAKDRNVKRSAGPQIRTSHCRQPPAVACKRPSSAPFDLPISLQWEQALAKCRKSSVSSVSWIGSSVCSLGQKYWNADEWKINPRKSLEDWTTLENWTPEWLKSKDLGELWRVSREMGSEWLDQEWQKVKDLQIPGGDWFGINENIRDGMELLPPSYPQIQRRCVPAVVVYDSGACTKEEDDPARAVLYFRPRHTPTTARTSLAGQLAGVVHFCRHAFATPTIVRTRHAHVALKDYGRFVLMVCGRGGEWARSRLTEVTRLLDASTGGLPHLWATCGRDQQTFASRLTEVLDALLPQAIPDADFRDEVSHVSPSSSDAPSTPSPAAEAAETVSEEGPDSNQKEEGKDEEAFSLLHQIFNAVPSVQLPKSGGGVFLRAQQVVEACQQHPGVLAGSTMHKDRVLSSQMSNDLSSILASLPLHSQKSGVLEDYKVEFRLPGGVHLHKLHIPKETYSTLCADVPKSMPRRGDRSLHGEVSSMDLTSFRSVLHSRQSLHSYPSTLPTAMEATEEVLCPSPSETQKHTQNPLRGPSLLARINGCSELDARSSQSLPGSPRKIRVTATLPDVGSNSPDLRYKVLTGRKPRPPASTHSSPRRLPGGRNGLSRTHDSVNNGVVSSSSKRSSNFGVPDISRLTNDKKNQPNNKLMTHTGGDTSTKLGYESEKSESGFEDGVQSDTELNIKNTKNKLNLQFAPDKINRPSPEIELDGLSNDEPKIMREINGNLSKDSDSNNKESPNDNVPNLKSQALDYKDESDTSRSEESEISVLDLSTYLETKENGDRQLAEAVRGLMELTTRADDEENFRQEAFSADSHLTESGQHEAIASAEGWEVLTLYTQKHSDCILHLLITCRTAADPKLIYALWRVGLSGLQDVQTAVERAMEVSEVGDNGDAFLQWSYNILSAVMPSSVDRALVSMAHQDFKLHQSLMEVTLRSGEAVLWAHRHSSTETFYQVNAAPRPGLPIPSDIMAKVPHRARRRLDRDHNITLL